MGDQIKPETRQNGQNAQSQSQQEGRQARLRIDERNLVTAYANSFRTNASAEEVILDLGLNLVTPTGQSSQSGEGSEASSQPDAEILFQANHRVVMNYYTAKRLAINLSQLVRQHEQRFGELQLNVSERQENPSGSSEAG